jgi:hypothetical protein
MPFNGELWNGLALLLREFLRVPSTLRRLNVLTIAQEEVIPNCPEIVLLENRVDFARTATAFPTNQALTQGVESRPEKSVSGMQTLQQPDPFAALCKSCAQFGVQFDELAE